MEIKRDLCVDCTNRLIQNCKDCDGQIKFVFMKTIKIEIKEVK